MSTLSTVVPLSGLAAGEQGAVLRLEGGHGFIGRMVALGFTPGVAVGVVRNPSHGPLIVSVLGTQVALGRGQAEQVQVRRVEACA